MRDQWRAFGGAERARTRGRLQTVRLELLPLSVDAALAAVGNRDALELLLGVKVPGDWPAQELGDYLPAYAHQLKEDPALLGWGVWLIVHREERVAIGDLGFKGQPDQEGSVETGYSVLPAYRRQGYAFEATRALVDWALGQPGLKRITAECSPDNVPSIHILEKLGMRRLESSGSLLKWKLEAVRYCDRGRAKTPSLQ